MSYQFSHHHQHHHQFDPLDPQLQSIFLIIDHCTTISRIAKLGKILWREESEGLFDGSLEWFQGQLFPCNFVLEYAILLFVKLYLGIFYDYLGHLQTQMDSICSGKY